MRKWRCTLVVRIPLKPPIAHLPPVAQGYSFCNRSFHTHIEDEHYLPSGIKRHFIHDAQAVAAMVQDTHKGAAQDLSERMWGTCKGERVDQG